MSNAFIQRIAYRRSKSLSFNPTQCLVSKNLQKAKEKE